MLGDGPVVSCEPLCTLFAYVLLAGAGDGNVDNEQLQLYLKAVAYAQGMDRVREAYVAQVRKTPPS